MDYPVKLRLEVRRAARLAHAVSRLLDRVHPDDASFPWLLGRADEVRAVAGAAVRDWHEGRIDEWTAADRVRSYVRGLYETLHAYYGRGPASSSHVRARPVLDTLVDPGPPPERARSG